MVDLPSLPIPGDSGNKVATTWVDMNHLRMQVAQACGFQSRAFTPESIFCY